MLGAAVLRSLGLIIFAGFALFWSYNLFGSQNLTEDGQSVALAPIERGRATHSEPVQPLLGDAKLIAEVLHSADELGLKVLIPGVGSAAVKTTGTGSVVENPPPIKSVHRQKGTSALRGQRQDSPPAPPAAPVSNGLIRTADVSREAVQALPEAVMPYNECQANYGTAKFLPKDERRKPPVLYTFPGSGNTWARLLIDKASGILSGSVYNDRSLVPALPGELACDWSVSVVKAHPHTHTAASLLKGGFHSDGKMKCTRGQIRTFEKAVLLIRDPYNSIWSEYQRRASASHVSGIQRDKFDTVQWLANACNLANRYLEMWSKQYELLEKSLPRENILYVKYEDLTNKNKRIGALKSIMTFIGFPDITEERIACAFALANSKHAKRSVDDTMITKKELYTENKDLVCKMWATFGEYAEKHGYAPWNDYDCSDYSMKLVDMNVGPAGTLNRQWMMKRGIDMMEMKKGVAPVGDYSTPGFFNKGGRQRPDGSSRQGQFKRGPRGRDAAAGKEVADAPPAANLVGLGFLGKDKPAWKED